MPGKSVDVIAGKRSRYFNRVRKNLAGKNGGN
jgi:hypothetical protein